MSQEQASKTSDIRKVALASMIGTTIEWYDFVIYSQAAALVFGPLFFSDLGPSAGVLAGFATFGVGFLARPVGALVFGHFGDRIGRRTTLVTTLSVMGVATLLVGLLPTYSQIGWWAPVLLVVLRLIQGFAVGGEWGGAVLMAVEHAPPNRRGFYGSWPQMGIPISLILATGVLTLLSANMADEMFLTWGWRLPFLASAALIAVGLVIRLKIAESPEFLRLQREGRQLKLPLMDVLRNAKRHTLLVIGSMTAVNVGYYVIIVFALSYATTNVGLSRTTTLVALMVAAFADLIAVPLFASLSDRIGRKPVLFGGSIFIGLFGYPFFMMVNSGDPTLLTIAASLGLAFGHAPVYATLATFFAEGYGARSRYSGVSIAYNFGNVVSSGPTPFIAAALVAGFASYVPVVVMMAAAAVISVVCLALLRETMGKDLSEDYTTDDGLEVLAEKRAVA